METKPISVDSKRYESTTIEKIIPALLLKNLCRKRLTILIQEYNAPPQNLNIPPWIFEKSKEVGKVMQLIQQQPNSLDFNVLSLDCLTK